MHKWLSSCTIAAMEKNKQQLMQRTMELQKVARKLARIEGLPVVVGEGVEISTREAHTIQAIGEQGPLCVKDLATCFGVSKSAASQMVSKLARKGFIVKQPSAHSNKEIELSLTAMGWQACRAHEQSHGRDMARIVEAMEKLSPGEMKTLKKLLEIFSEIADERLNSE
ncbi:MarR family winged helix-turn-helix transcriptional regulator [Syntrophotalea acetylenivorans]|nr:MarR family transcriptional regulator [Syntrophotalea acetylenivorans]